MKQQLPSYGLSDTDLKKELHELRSHDVPWREGKVFGYVFHVDEASEKIIQEAHNEFMWDNALDPRLFQSLFRMEQAVVRMVATNLSGDENVVGNMTSGGTESILLAMKTARDFSRKEKKMQGRLNVVLPVTAHAAFHKAAHYFELDLRVADVDPETCAVDIKEMESLIDEQTIMLVGSKPSYAHGTSDPIEAIAALAKSKNLLCHVDGCVGGWLLPFMAREGFDVAPFDFSLEGVTSISIDLHKYAFAAKGASVVLYRNEELRYHQIFSCSQWTGYAMINPTILSTKSGGPIAGAYAALKHFGDSGYRKVARALRESSQQIIEALNADEDFFVFGKPEMSLLAFGSNTLDLFLLSDELAKRGWEVQPQHKKGKVAPSIHLTIMPHSIPYAENFLKDLRELKSECRKKFSFKKLATKGLANFVSDNLSVNQAEKILDQVGVKFGELPDGGMSEVNHAMNELNYKAIDQILKVYANKLYK